MFSGHKKFVLVALFTALLIVLVNLTWWFHYRETRQLLDQQLSRRLAAVAGSATAAISAEQGELLVTGEVDSYLQVIETLAQIRSADSLSEVFVLSENYYYLATTLLEPDSVYFLSALNGPYIDSLFFGASIDVVLTPTYRTGQLYLKTAFAPILGSDGYVLAVLGVEANVDYFDALVELRRNLYYTTGLSLLGGIILGMLFLLLQRRISLAEEQLFLGQTHAHLGRMVAVVAHELKNPLMIIRGSAERLAKKTEMAEAEYVIEEVDRLNGIVTGYLDFARSGGSLLAGDDPAPIDLGELLASVRKHLIEKYSDNEIVWLGGKPAVSPFVGYPRSLRQVLLNLLSNGVESCRDAGKPIEVGVETAADGNSVILRVVDHGRGLTRKELKRAFAPFYSTKQSGSGLGLYLSREVVIQMGGDTEIVSEPDTKTEVMIKLPRQPETEP